MKIALITGGLGGIGFEIVQELSKEMKCIVLDIKENDYNTVFNGEYLKVDITKQHDLLKLKDYLEMNSIKIDYFIHTAAIGFYKPFMEMSSDEWRKVLQVNLEGTLAITQTLVPFLKDGGRIIYFSSGTVFKGTENVAPYVASKAGVIGFARSLSAELGSRNITVNVIAPGFTETSLIEDMRHVENSIIASRAIKRKEYPSDLVGPVKFFLSKDADFITGQTIVVDGGSVKH